MDATQAGKVTCTCLLKLSSTEIDDAVETRNLRAGYYGCFENIHIVVIYIGRSTCRWNCLIILLLQFMVVMCALLILPFCRWLQFRYTMRVMYAVCVIMFMIYQVFVNIFDLFCSQYILPLISVSSSKSLSVQTIASGQNS